MTCTRESDRCRTSRKSPSSEKMRTWKKDDREEHGRTTMTEAWSTVTTMKAVFDPPIRRVRPGPSPPWWPPMGTLTGVRRKPTMDRVGLGSDRRRRHYRARSEPVRPSSTICRMVSSATASPPLAARNPSDDEEASRHSRSWPPDSVIASLSSPDIYRHGGGAGRPWPGTLSSPAPPLPPARPDIHHPVAPRRDRPRSDMAVPPGRARYQVHVHRARPLARNQSTNVTSRSSST